MASTAVYAKYTASTHSVTSGAFLVPACAIRLTVSSNLMKCIAKRKSNAAQGLVGVVGSGVRLPCSCVSTRTDGRVLLRLEWKRHAWADPTPSRRIINKLGEAITEHGWE